MTRLAWFPVAFLLGLSGLIYVQLDRLKLVPEERPTWDHPILIRSPTNESMSACLLTFDDNHFLTEWLAFHYQTLPLRRLIVAVDPRARTSPSSILNRWSGLINTTLWKDEDYFPRSYRMAILRSKRYTKIEDRLLQLHRFRQRFFYLHCMKQLKKEGGETNGNDTTTLGNLVSRKRNWVALIDVDEFLFPNPNWSFQHLLSASSPEDETSRQVLHRVGSYETYRRPCISLPRLLVGAKKDSSTEQDDVPTRSLLRKLGIAGDDSSLLTTTWKWHAKLVSAQFNKAGKALVDVSGISNDLLTLEQIDVHRPVNDLCSADDMWIQNQESPWIVHHYVGSLDQFTFRSDPRLERQGQEKYEAYREVDYGRLSLERTSHWLHLLVDALGPEKVARLLEGVGQIETNFSTPQFTLQESYNALYKDVEEEFIRNNATYMFQPMAVKSLANSAADTTSNNSAAAEDKTPQ